MPSIIFDLDGTLIDTAPDLVATLNVILQRQGLHPVGYDEARAMIGDGAKKMLERSVLAHQSSLPEDELERLYRDFLVYYSDHIADCSRPFPGLLKALDALATRGWRLAVCTNKLEWLSVKLLDELKLKERFTAICGQDTFGIAKPNPEVLIRTIEAAGGDLQSAIMVGDSLTDIATARAAGVPVIAVDFGYTSTHVSQLGPDLVIGHYDALLQAVEALQPRRA
ncbi:MAG: HAD-IA family hydrolase [Xanthobacteraceae bacterium]